MGLYGLPPLMGYVDYGSVVADTLGRVVLENGYEIDYVSGTTWNYISDAGSTLYSLTEVSRSGWKVTLERSDGTLFEIDIEIGLVRTQAPGGSPTVLGYVDEYYRK